MRLPSLLKKGGPVFLKLLGNFGAVGDSIFFPPRISRASGLTCSKWLKNQFQQFQRQDRGGRLWSLLEPFQGSGAAAGLRRRAAAQSGLQVDPSGPVQRVQPALWWDTEVLDLGQEWSCLEEPIYFFVFFWFLSSPKTEGGSSLKAFFKIMKHQFKTSFHEFFHSSIHQLVVIFHGNNSTASECLQRISPKVWGEAKGWDLQSHLVCGENGWAFLSILMRSSLTFRRRNSWRCSWKKLVTCRWFQIVEKHLCMIWCCWMVYSSFVGAWVWIMWRLKTAMVSCQSAENLSFFSVWLVHKIIGNPGNFNLYMLLFWGKQLELLTRYSEDVEVPFGAKHSGADVWLFRMSVMQPRPNSRRDKKWRRDQLKCCPLDREKKPGEAEGVEIADEGRWHWLLYLQSRFDRAGAAPAAHAHAKDFRWTTHRDRGWGPIRAAFHLPKLDGCHRPGAQWSCGTSPFFFFFFFRVRRGLGIWSHPCKPHDFAGFAGRMCGAGAPRNLGFRHVTSLDETANTWDFSSVRTGRQAYQFMGTKIILPNIQDQLMVSQARLIHRGRPCQSEGSGASRTCQRAQIGCQVTRSKSCVAPRCGQAIWVERKWHWKNVYIHENTQKMFFSKSQRAFISAFEDQLGLGPTVYIFERSKRTAQRAFAKPKDGCSEDYRQSPPKLVAYNTVCWCFLCGDENKPTPRCSWGRL